LELSNGILASIMQPDYLSLMRAIVAETPRLPHLGDLFRQAVAERAMESVSVFLEQARQEGVAEVDDLDDASRLLVGPLLTYTQSWTACSSPKGRRADRRPSGSKPSSTCT
jgi:hypothetical protein